MCTHGLGLGDTIEMSVTHINLSYEVVKQRHELRGTQPHSPSSKCRTTELSHPRLNPGACILSAALGHLVQVHSSLREG